jgi:hypothetical protein
MNILPFLPLEWNAKRAREEVEGGLLLLLLLLGCVIGEGVRGGGFIEGSTVTATRRPATSWLFTAPLERETDPTGSEEERRRSRVRYDTI